MNAFQFRFPPSFKYVLFVSKAHLLNGEKYSYRIGPLFLFLFLFMLIINNIDDRHEIHVESEGEELNTWMIRYKITKLEKRRHMV